MRLFEALNVFKIRDNVLSRKELKAIYRELAKEHHPDHGGDAELFKEISLAMEILIEQYTFIENPAEENEQYQKDKNYWYIFDQDMEVIYKKIFHLSELNIEICGKWMWVTGDTFLYRKELKEAGLFYAPKKQAWYYRPKDSKSYYGRGKTSLYEIREKYGSLQPDKSKTAFLNQQVD